MSYDLDGKFWREVKMIDAEDRDLRDATITVADAIQLARLAFEENGVSATAADLLRFAELVVAREQELLLRDAGTFA